MTAHEVSIQSVRNRNHQFGLNLQLKILSPCFHEILELVTNIKFSELDPKRDKECESLPHAENEVGCFTLCQQMSCDLFLGRNLSAEMFACQFFCQPASVCVSSVACHIALSQLDLPSSSKQSRLRQSAVVSNSLLLSVKYSRFSKMLKRPPKLTILLSIK